jgi:hypothetical protein
MLRVAAAWAWADHTLCGSASWLVAARIVELYIDSQAGLGLKRGYLRRESQPGRYPAGLVYCYLATVSAILHKLVAENV